MPLLNVKCHLIDFGLSPTDICKMPFDKLKKKADAISKGDDNKARNQIFDISPT